MTGKIIVSHLRPSCWLTQLTSDLSYQDVKLFALPYRSKKADNNLLYILVIAANLPTGVDPDQFWNTFSNCINDPQILFDKQARKIDLPPEIGSNKTSWHYYVVKSRIRPEQKADALAFSFYYALSRSDTLVQEVRLILANKGKETAYADFKDGLSWWVMKDSLQGIKYQSRSAYVVDFPNLPNQLHDHHDEFKKQSETVPLFRWWEQAEWKLIMSDDRIALEVYKTLAKENPERARLFLLLMAGIKTIERDC